MVNRIKHGLGFTLLALLAGCQVGTDYVAPQADIPATWRHQKVQEQQPAQEDTRWWDRFQDPKLSALIQDAAVHNKSLQRSAQRVKQYEALLGIAQSDAYPQVDLSGKGERLKYSKAALGAQDLKNPYQWRLQGVINLSYELDFWGRVRRQEESALAQLLAQEAAQRTVCLTVTTAVAQGYFTLRALDATLLLARETVGLAQSQYDLVQRQLNEGMVSALELEEAKTQLETAKQTVSDLEQQVATQEHALCALLGRNPGAIVRGKALEHIHLPDIRVGVLPSQLLKQRPDIYQAEQELRSKHADVGVAEAAFLPKINLLALIGAQSMDSGSFFTKNAMVGGIGGGLTAPLFQGGRIQQQLESAKAHHREALIAYLETLQTAFQETEDALVGTQKKRQAYHHQRTVQKAQAKTYQLQQARFQQGLISRVELLRARKMLLQTTQQTLRLRLEAFLEQVKLYKALGGG